EDSDKLLVKDRERVKQYEAIDDTSATSWKKGEMILWNDLEAQNTSIEIKNLLNRYRTPENQCLDVYVVPAAKTPSRSIKEAKDYGRLTHRGGAALSSRLFPRTTANKGHAIILTYNSGSSEYRLAHELGHLLIHKNNAHEGKVEKDLMHANSRGGSYLSEAECREIAINLRNFRGGTSKND
ncbi:MAG: ImmA/IrrE family metallo-endopeptidase, partial [Gammaproteobacteria bacterium]